MRSAPSTSVRSGSRLQPGLERRVADQLGRVGEDTALTIDQRDDLRVLEAAIRQPAIAGDSMRVEKRLDGAQTKWRN